MGQLHFYIRACATLFLISSVGAQELPDLVPADLILPTVITGAPNPRIQVVWRVLNQGEGSAAGFWEDSLHLSSAPPPEGPMEYVYGTMGSSPLAAGADYWHTNEVTLRIYESGTYFLILKVNRYNYLPESNPQNNQLVQSFTFVATPADLAPIGFIAPAVTNVPPRPYITVTWGVTNLGPGEASGGWYDRLYFSTNSVLDSGAVEVAWQDENVMVPSGQGYWRTKSVRLPATESGAYFLLFSADANNMLHEAATNNNLWVAPIQLNIEKPDLAVLELQFPAAVTGAPNPSLNFSYVVTNLGPGAAVADPPWYDALYLSFDPVLDDGDQVVMSHSEYLSIGARGRYWRTNAVTFPVVTNGAYYLIFKADSWNSLIDANPQNNLAVWPVAFTILPPDLVPMAKVPAVFDGPPYPYLSVAFGATNQGTGPATGDWHDAVYFSTKPSIDGAYHLTTTWWGRPVPAGSTYWSTNQVRLPVASNGNYFLIFKTDNYNHLYESDRNNNVLAVPFELRIHPPDLAPAGLLLANSITSPPNPELTVVWGITNRGTGAAVGNSYWHDLLYISTNSVWDATATRLDEQLRDGPVAPGEAYWSTNVFRLPVVRSGTWYFHLRTDNLNELIEADENNNGLVIPVAFTIHPPDLVPLVDEIPREIVGPPRPKLNLVWGVTNQGTGLARASWPPWYDAIYFSLDPVLDDQDPVLTSWDPRGPLASGSAYRQTNTVIVPAVTSGTSYLIFKADRNNALFEENKSNNVAVVPVNFTILPPDLVPVDLQVPQVISGPPKPSCTIAWHVANQGIGAAQIGLDPWNDGLFLSSDSTLDAADVQIFLKNETGPVPAGQDYWRTNSLRLPIVNSTNLHLIFKTDVYQILYESDENNNALALPVQFNVALPDLTPIALVATNAYTGPPNPMLTLTWGVTNQGAGQAEALANSYWMDRVYLSTTNMLNASATLIATREESPIVSPAGAYWRTNLYTVPVRQSGAYYLLFVTDQNQAVYESNFVNNMLAVPVSFTIQPPDLAPIALMVPPIVNSTPKPTVSIIWGVTNSGVGPAQGQWRDRLYFSSSPDLGYSTPELSEDYQYGPVAPGQTYWRTNYIEVPVVESGTYYFIFKTDYNDALAESDPGNNTIVMPVVFNISPPDLVPVAIHVPALITDSVYPVITVAWAVTNQGTGSTAGHYWYDRLRISSAPPPDDWGEEVFGFGTFTIIPPEETAWFTNMVRLPIAESGTYYLTLNVNESEMLYESSFENNQLWVPISVQIQPPDLAPIYFKAPAEVSGGIFPAVKLTWGVTNQGPGIARAHNQWSDLICLSTDPVLDPTDTWVNGNSETAPISPEGNYWRAKTANVPVTESGLYYLILSVDHDGELHDLNYSNNTAVVPVRFNIQAPDLAPLGLDIPTQLDCSPNAPVMLVWGITNQGIGAAHAHYGDSWCDRILFSSDTNPFWNARELQFVYHDGELDPGQSIWRTNIVRIPAVESGTYYWFFLADDSSAVLERCETNNALVVPVVVNVTLPDLTPETLRAPASISGSGWPLVEVAFAVTNQGPGEAIPGDIWWDELLISRTNILDGSETSVKWFKQEDSIGAGSTYSRTNLVELPVFESGNYHLFLKVNHGLALAEANASNNMIALGPIAIEIAASDVSPLVQHVPSNIEGSPNPFLTVAWGITNQGPGTAVSAYYYWPLRVYFSTRPVLDETAMSIQWLGITESLPPGGASWFTNRLRLPVSTNGSYYLLFLANPENTLHEVNTTNDLAVVPINVAISLPDLATVAFFGPESAVGQISPGTVNIPTGFPVDLVWGVTNQGAGPADSYWSEGRRDALLICTNADFSYPILVDSWAETNSVPPGGSYWRTNHARLPITQSGTFYLKFVANAWDSVAESDDLANNIAVRPITVEVRPPDLAPLGFQAPAEVTGSSYPELTVVWGVTNRGTGPAQRPPAWPAQGSPLADAIYLSSDSDQLQPWGDPLCAVFERKGSLEAGAFEWHTNVVRVPVSESGTRHLVFKTDSFGVAMESDEQNNSLIIPVTFHLTPPADLTVTSFIVPRVVSGPGNPTVTLAWHIVNAGPGLLPTANRYDTLRLLGPSGYYSLASFLESGALLPGEGYWRTNTLVLPVTESGQYRLSLEAHNLFDLEDQDNEATSSITFHQTAPPLVKITQPVLGHYFVMDVFGLPGADYQLQASQDLVTWTRVLDFVCVTNPTRVYDENAHQFTFRFYRIAPVSESAALRLGFAQKMWTPHGLRLFLDGPLNRNFRVESSADLETWTVITNLSTDLAPTGFYDGSISSESHRFYRAVVE